MVKVRTQCRWDLMYGANPWSVKLPLGSDYPIRNRLRVCSPSFRAWDRIHCLLMLRTNCWSSSVRWRNTMNPMVEHLLNQNLPDHERLGVTPAPQRRGSRSCRTAYCALLDPHLTDHFRQQGQSILSVLAPRSRRSSADCGNAAAGSVPPKADSPAARAAFDRLRRQLLSLLSRRFRGPGRRKILALAQRHGVKPEQLGNILLGLAQWSQTSRGRLRPNRVRVGVAEHITAF